MREKDKDRTITAKADNDGVIQEINDSKTTKNSELPFSEISWPEYRSKEGSEFFNSLPKE